MEDSLTERVKQTITKLTRSGYLPNDQSMQIYECDIIYILKTELVVNLI